MLASVIRHEKGTFSIQHYMIRYGLSGCTTLFPYEFKNAMIFGKKNLEHELWVLIFCTNFYLKHFSFCEERIPTRCNNIDDLLSIPYVDY